MNFKIKKISKASKSTIFALANEKFRAAKHFSKIPKISFNLIASILIILTLVIGIVKATKSIDFKVFLKAAGNDLKQDAYGHTNFLVLGTGGKNHEGADLTDTIMVASLDSTNKLVTIISIPRDLFLKKTQFGNQKINQLYYEGKKQFNNSTQGLAAMKDEMEKFTGIPIHYWIKMDFDGFKELVDALGGVDIDVKKSINDPFYPKDGTFLYEPFNINTGLQHMNGETALKYARSRKTSSDFDRADRQQEIINAIKEKALQTRTILSESKITKILDTLKANIETNISARELLTLGGIATDFTTDKIVHRMIHNDPSRCGGLLYNPPIAQYYDMYVLLPADKQNLTKKFLDLSLDMPQIGMENTKIQIFNGTKRIGAAAETKQVLRRFCFDITRFGNGADKNFTRTTYYYRPDSRPQALDFLQKIIPGLESTAIPEEYVKTVFPENTDIVLKLGADYTTSSEYIEDAFYGLEPEGSKVAIPAAAATITPSPLPTTSSTNTP